MTFLHIIFNILEKKEKNRGHRLSVPRLILLSNLKRIKTIESKNMFICFGHLSEIMGYHATGNQKYITLAYQIMQARGAMTTDTINSIIKSEYPKVRVPSKRVASNLFAKHPMFETLPYWEVTGDSDTTHKVRCWDVIPEGVVVVRLYDKVKNNVSLSFKYSKYPQFIREQVEHLLESDSPTKSNDNNLNKTNQE
jgi:hypothetical protein